MWMWSVNMAILKEFTKLHWRYVAKGARSLSWRLLCATLNPELQWNTVTWTERLIDSMYTLSLYLADVWKNDQHCMLNLFWPVINQYFEVGLENLMGYSALVLPGLEGAHWHGIWPSKSSSVDNLTWVRSKFSSSAAKFYLSEQEE